MWYKKIAIIIAVVMMAANSYFVAPNVCFAANEVYTQTDWSGGSSTANALHPTDKTGWNKYSSKDANINTSQAGKVILSPAATAITETTDTDFNAGVYSHTELTGTGASAAVKLTPTVQDPFSSSLDSWGFPKQLPVGVGAGGALCYPGTGDFIYAAKGHFSNEFLKYSIPLKRWYHLADLPKPIGEGSDLAYYDGDIYCMQGNGWQGFWKYNIASNIWVSLNSTPQVAGVGAKLVYAVWNGNPTFFAARGDLTITFWAYNISTGQWSSTVDLPADVRFGSSFCWDGGNYLYYKWGEYKNFYRLDLITNAWVQLTNTPEDVYAGSALCYPGTGDFIYLTRGTQDFWKYSIAGNNWTSISYTPSEVDYGGDLVYNPANSTYYGWGGGAGDNWYPELWEYSSVTNKWSKIVFSISRIESGGSLCYDGTDYIYSLGGWYGYTGNSARYFFRYSNSANNWEQLAYVPADITSEGAGLTYAGGYVYALRGSSSTDFWQYDPDGNTWVAKASTPAAVGVGGALVYPGSGDFIYAIRGAGTTDFWKYTISTDTWSSLTVTPQTINQGADLIFYSTGSEDFIYCLAGNAGNFFRYSLTTTTWQSLTACPENINYGGDLAYPGTGDTIYAIVGNERSYLLGYSISGNSWQYLESMPFYRRTYSGSSLVNASGSNYLFATRGYDSRDFARYNILTGHWDLPALQVSTLRNGASFIKAGSFIYCLQGNYTKGFLRYSFTADKWEYMAPILKLVGEGGSLAYAGGDFIYAIIGGYQKNFYKYSISADTWAEISQLPNTISQGGSLIWSGGDYLFALRGKSQDFYRYTISTDTWDIRAFTASTVDYGSVLLAYAGGDYIYAARGNGTSFWRYTISTNLWSNMASTPYGLEEGSAIVYSGTGDYIYCMQGGYSPGLTGFWRYSISQNTWQVMAKTPIDITYGSAIATDGSDFIYVYPGDGYGDRDFFRYSISQNQWCAVSDGVYSGNGGKIIPVEGKIYSLIANDSKSFYEYNPSIDKWSILPGPPANAYYGAAICYVKGSDYLYLLRGYNTTDFYRYSLSQRTWGALSSAPAGISGGSSLVYPGTGDFVYALRGGATSDAWKYSISTNTWQAISSTPGTINDGGYLVSDGGDYLYTMRGSNDTAFYRYSITSNGWVSMATVPGTVYDGGSLCYPGFGDYIYALRGYAYNALASYDFWKYSISSNSWEQICSTPIRITTSAGLAYPGGEYIYARCGDSRYLLKYHLFSSGTFTSTAKNAGTNGGFGTITWTDNTDNKNSFINIKARTDNDSSMSSAGSWSNASLVAKGADLSTYSSVSDGNSYLQYQATFLTSDITKIPQLDDLTFNYDYYPQKQELISSAYNTTASGNRLMKLSWNKTLLQGTDLRFQLRTAQDSSGSPGTWGSWIGPTGATVITNDFSLDADYSVSSLLKLQSGTAGLKKELEDFQYKQAISIDNSAGSAQTNVIVGVDLPVNNNLFWSRVQASGNDIRFYDGTQKLSYKLVKFDYSKKSAVVSVKIPSLAAGETKTIYMLYGSANALSEEDTTLYDASRNGLKAWWKFDETSGTSVSDSSGNSASGSFIDSPVWGTGKNGNALQFDGINDFVSSASGVFPITGVLTVGIWVKPAVIGEQGICGKNDNGSNYWTYRLYMNSTGNIVFQRGSNSGGWQTTLTSNAVLPVDTWSYLTAVYDGATMKLYINNTLDNSVSETRSSGSGTNPFVVGTNTYTNSDPTYNINFTFKGLIDNVCVFNRAVTDAERTALYNGNSGISTVVGSSVSPEENTSGTALGASWPYRRKITVANPSADNLTNHQVGVDFSTLDLNSIRKPVASWHFSEGSGTTVVDTSGNGNNGTINDATWTTSGKFGNALSFDGVNDSVSVGNAASLNNIQSGITIEAWVYPIDNDWHASNIHLIAGKSTYPASGWQFNMMNSGWVQLTTYDGALHSVQGSIMIPLNQWSHVVGWSDGTTNKVFINGIERGSAASGTLIASTSNLGINSSSDLYAFHGSIDELRIYNRALSVQEIQSHYNSNSNMGLDFVDFRFVWVNPADNSEQVIPHWFETDNKAWIKIPSISAYTAQTVYMYYGNATASSTSSFDNVFTKDYGTDPFLAGSWHFDENTGTNAVDSSGRGNNGTLTNGPVWQASDGGQWGSRSDIKFTSGSFLNFDGANDYVDLGNGASLNITNAITIEAWINTNASAYWYTIYSKGYQLHIYTGSPKITFPDTATGTAYGVFQLNAWQHIAVTYDSSLSANNSVIYVNGVVKAINTVASLTPSGNAKIGTGGYIFNGSIDEVRVYNRALSVGEIQAHYQRRKYSSPELAATLSLYTETANAYSSTNYNTVNSVIQPIFGAFYNNDLAEFQETASKPAGSEIKYQVSPNGYRWYWWTGSAWAAVTGGYSEANTAATINSNLATFMTQVSTSGEFFYRAYLHSDTGTATPSLDQVKIATATSTSFYLDSAGATSINVLNNDAFNDQWFQYKAILYSSGKDTPILDDVTLEYITALIAITSPNTAVTWQIGSNQSITWTASGLPAGDTVKISYSTDAGSNWNLITANVTATNGTYPWTVPEAQTAQSRIKVTSNALPAVYDISDVNFTIGGIKITAPNSGETWEVGTAHNITWTTVGTVSNQLTIEYSKDDFATSTLIADQQANDGAYSWLVPNDVSNAMKIRVRDTVSPFAVDTSDLNLRVQPVPQITVNIPNGGEAWQVGTEHQITWTANAAVSNNLKFEYSKDNFVSDVHEIKSLQVALPGWNYSIPVTINNSTNTNNLTDYQVKISIDSTLSSFWNHVRSDGSDIRFYDYNPATILPYYLDTFDYANKNAVIYVKLPLIPASSSKIINLCYGNPSAVSVSSFDNVFPTGYSETGLAGLWHFDKINNQQLVTDSSGNNNNGALIGGVSWTGLGKIGNAMNFDGIDDYVNVPHASSLVITTNMTISAWVKKSADVSWQRVIEKSPWPACDYFLLFDDTGKIYGGFKKGGVQSSTSLSNSALAVGTWYHVAVTYDNSKLRLYVNGVEQGTATPVTGSIDNNAGNLLIGAGVGGFNNFNGSIDEVRIYNRALSEEEIQAHYRRQKTTSPEPAVSFGAEKGNVLSTPTLPYYKVITINNSGATLTDYQFKIALDSSDTSFWSHVKSDAGDIRLYDDSTELAYWIESFNYAGKSAVIWIKLPSVLVSSTKKVYLYYGNSSLTTLSSYDNVFTKDYGESGLAGLWHMDAGAGNIVVDASGNGNNGTLNGRVGLTFDGYDDYVEMGSPANLEPANVTVEAWVKLASLSTTQMLVGQDAPVSGSGKGYELYFFQPGQSWQFEMRGTDWKGTGSTFNVDTTNWHHLVGTYDGTSLNLYVDGVLKSNVATTMAIQYREFTFRVGSGSAYSGSQYTNGRISGVRIYNRAISSVEVTEHYAGAYSNNTGLVGNWQMNDGGTSQTVTDSSGNGINGTRGATSAVEGTDPLWFTEPPTWQAQDGGQWGSRSDVKFNTGSSLSFDGVDDWIGVGSSDSINFIGTPTLTIEAWVNLIAYPGEIFNKGQTGPSVEVPIKNGYKLGINNNGNLLFTKNGVVDIESTLSPVPIGVWTHVAVVVNGSSHKFYVNGTEKQDIANSQNIVSASGYDAEIGVVKNQAGDRLYGYFHGTNDEVRVYNRALSVSEIQAQYWRSKYVTTVPTYTVGTEQANAVSTSNFLYNKLVTIDNSGNSNELTDYQVKVTLNNSQEFFWSHVKPDGADVRFYDGATELPYWIETFDYANKNAAIWVKVPSIPASSTKTIKLCYGNFAVVSASSFNSVFIKDYGFSGLVGCWHFDEGAGLSAADVSGNNNTGTLTNGPVWQGDVKFSIGSSVQLDGVNDYVDLGSSLILSDLTLSVWVYPTAAKQQYVVAKGNGTGYIRNYVLLLNSDNTVTYIRCDGSSQSKNVLTTQTVTLNAWNHIVVTDENKQVKIYINAGTPKSDSYTFVPTATNNPLRVGFHYGDSNTSRYFSGIIDELSIYNRALTTTEIQMHYEGYQIASPASVISVEGDSTANGSVYLWNIPDDVSSTVKVRITDNNRPTCIDKSDNNFSITQPAITLTSPNGGEVWVNGDTHNITWTTQGTVSNNLLFEYSKDNFVTAVTIVNNEANDGSFSWVIPNDPSSTVKVRITDNTRSVVTDASDNNFQILGHSSISLTSPNGNETLIMGDSHNITWVSYGAGVSNDLKLEYSIDNGTIWTLIADQQVNDGTYTWTLPNVETTQGLVRITDNTDALVTDTSDAAFTITIPTITLTIPNGAETWYATGNYNITWTSVGSVSNNLKLEYTTNGSAWTQVSTAETNDGSYPWTIPDVASSTCKVRITDTTRVAVTDNSDANFSILAPTITLTTPNGAEEWVVGTAHDITWTSVGANNSIKDNLTLQYSKDNFVSSVAISSGQANDGSYTWTIPDDVSATVKVKIFDASRPSTVDTSNANFSITQPYVRITSPNGGESWVNTTQHNITWVSLGTISNNLKLEYSKDNFVTPISIATGETNDGTYAWTVPDDVSATVKVRITDLNRLTATDASDASFSIAESIVTVTRPNGAELFTVGDAENITWISTGTVNNNLKLEYSKDNFAAAGIQIAAGLSNNGTYSWTVPVDVSATVRVRITDSSRLAVWDKSNADFTILPVPQITVVTPNGGQTWMVGSIYTISWSDNGGLVSNNLTIQYSSDGGAGWISISSGEANDGSLAWTIPDDVSTNCKARIYDASRPANSDVSDSTFTIANPLITVTSPNGGEFYAIGDAPVITWTTEGAVSNNLTLQYTTDGTNFTLIKSAQSNTGSYPWTVPDVISSSVKVKITDGNRPASNDLSNNNFTVMQYPALTVSAPNGNEVYVIGDVLPVTWIYKGLNIQPLTISYSSDNFATSSVIATVVTHTLGSYNWTIPNNALATNTLKVKAYDPARTVISDTSDANFRIKGGFTITAPAANARFIAKKAETISWTTRGIVANVKLEYSIDNGISWNTIIPSVANTGTYSWAVADNRTANYTAKVRVSDALDSTIEATSGAFKIDYYTISWRVMDYDTSASLQQLSAKDSFWNDQSNTISSPVEHDYPYGAYTTFWKKEGYIDRSTEWTADSEKIVTIYLENQITASVEWHVLISNAYNADSDTLKVSTWLERRGKLVGSTASDLADLQSATIEIHDGTALVKTMTTTTHDNQGVFWFDWANTGLESNKTYFVKAAVSFRSATYTSGASIDVTSAKKMLDEKLQLQTLQTQVDTTRVAVSDSTAQIKTKIDQSQAAIEMKVSDVKTETAKILTATETTLPQKVDEMKEDVSDKVEAAKEEMQAGIKSEILNRENTVRSGQTLVVRFRTYSKLAPVMDLYNAANVLEISKAVMTEVGTTGIYEYSVRFEAAWGKGDFTVVCSESTKGTMDALVISVIRSDIEQVAGQVSAVLGSTTGLGDLKSATEVLTSQFSMIEIALGKITKDAVSQVKEIASSASGLESVFTQLVNISKELHGMSNTGGADIEKLYKVTEEKKNDLMYLKNKTQELKAAMDINNKMLQNVSKKPVVQTWFEYKL